MDEKVRYLSARWECWNCDNTCPEKDGVGFEFIAVEADGEWHPICQDCSDLEMQTAIGPVTIYQQVKKNVVIRKPCPCEVQGLGICVCKRPS